MTKKSDAPAIRFKGFSDAWEQRKLGDISEIKTGPFGSTLHADDYVSDGTPIITTEHFKTGALPRSKNGLPQVSDSDYKRLTAYTLDDGDIVFSRVGSVDINALITPFQSNWLFSGRVLRVRPQTDISSKFLHTRLETESIKTDIRTRAVGQTMPSINTEILKITPLVLPSSAAEQEQIGSYFAALDNLITLHQRKFEKLTNVKKSMLEKMFPQNGSSYPEIRFKGFTDPWEQRKVSELFRVTRGYVLAATQTETTKTDEKPYPVYSSQTKDKGLMGYYKDYLYEDAITWTTDGANAGTVNYRAGKFYCTNVCGVLLSNEVKANQMIAEALNSVAKGYVSYVGNPKLMNNVMADIVIQIPTQAEEREQLSSFFAKLDNLITLHQRKLEKLQNIKKSMLEKMFV